MEVSIIVRLVARRSLALASGDTPFERRVWNIEMKAFVGGCRAGQRREKNYQRAQKPHGAA
jgi:hypothetical protein